MTGLRPLKILFVANYGAARAKSGCTGIFVERQARSLQHLGITVEAFDIGRSHSPLALLRSWTELRRTIRTVKPNLLHAQYGTIVALLSVLSLHPTIITFSGSDLLPGASISLARTYAGIFLSNVASLFARRVICVSEQLRKAMWWRKRKVTVIPRGVDCELFSPGSQQEARRQLGWQSRGPVVLIDGGRDWKNKGLDVAQAAMEIARGEIPALELEVLRNVPPDDMPLWYRAADALICASRQEGSPNVVKEALACNLPIVGVDVGDVRERLAGVVPSEVVDRTPEAIAASVIRLIRRGERSNGRDHVEALSLPEVARRIADVYAAALVSE
jgi:teichuronic acid biosynthesis glycosyltransferase TuaC